MTESKEKKSDEKKSKLSWMSCLCQWKLLLLLANDKGRGEGEGMLESSERAGKCSKSRDWMYRLWAVKGESWLILYWSILHWTCSWREQVIRRCCVVADTGSGWWGELLDGWIRMAVVMTETAKKVFDVTFGQRKGDKETWFWTEDIQDHLGRS